MITVYTQIYILRKNVGRFASKGGNPNMLLTNQLANCVVVKDFLDLNVWKGLKLKMVILVCLMSLHFKIFVFVDEAANPFSSLTFVHFMLAACQILRSRVAVKLDLFFTQEIFRHISWFVGVNLSINRCIKVWERLLQRSDKMCENTIPLTKVWN